MCKIGSVLYVPIKTKAFRKKRQQEVVGQAPAPQKGIQILHKKQIGKQDMGAPEGVPRSSPLLSNLCCYLCRAGEWPANNMGTA